MFICVFVLICVRARCARARVRVCMRACVSACACLCISIGLRLRARVCVASVCVCSERVRAPRRCARPPIARRRLAVLMARPAPCVGGCARVVAFGATGGARARRPQVSRGRAARPRRDGLRDLGTRPWSTPPAPSTSSAAKAPTISISPTSTTCTRAPTEVRGRTRSGDGSVGYWVGIQGLLAGVLRGTKGYSGVLRGY
jgi:hypothetical protein